MLRDNRYREDERNLRSRLPMYDERKEVESEEVVEEVVPSKVKKTVTTALNVRKEPNGAIVQVLSKGDIVEVIKEDGEWSQIGENKYVMTKFLKK